MQSRLRWAHRLAPLAPALAVAALDSGRRWDLDAIVTVGGIALGGHVAHALLGAPLLRRLGRRGRLTFGWTVVCGAAIGALVYLGSIVAFVAWVEGSYVTRVLAEKGLSITATGAAAGALAGIVFALIAGLPFRRRNEVSEAA